MTLGVLLRNFSRCYKLSFTDVLLSPKTTLRARPSLYHAMQENLDIFANRTTGVANVQNCRQTVIKHVAFKKSTRFPSTDQRFGFSSGQPANDAKASVRRWPKFVAGAIVIAFTSVWVFRKWRERNFRKRGFFPLRLPYMPYQVFTPFGKYKGTIINSTMLNSIEKIPEFNVREDDIFVVSFPRSGTTWTQELVYLIGNDADCEKAKSENLEARFPYLENATSTLEELNSASSPRFIKTHLPYKLLPSQMETKKPKIIYVMRNPKDVLVSNHHLWSKFRGGYKGKFTDFCELFLTDDMLFTPWTDHVGEFWKRRHHDNILFLKYEDLNANLTQEVRKISKFLGKSLTNEQIESIVDHCSFVNMKKNPKVNYNWWDEKGLTDNLGNTFMRKGRVGDWKNHFPPELNVRIDEKVEKELKAMGLDVTYEQD